MEGKLSVDKAKHMFGLIDAWQQSDITQQEFCKNQGIPYSKFHYWYKRYRQQHSGEASVAGFKKIELTDPLVFKKADGAWLVVQCTDGRQFSFNQPLGAELIRQLMM
jgi:hypothetical protein